MIPNRILVRLFNIAHDWHTAPYLRAQEGRRKLPVAAWRASRPIRRRAGQRQERSLLRHPRRHPDSGRQTHRTGTTGVAARPIHERAAGGAAADDDQIGVDGRCCHCASPDACTADEDSRETYTPTPLAALRRTEWVVYAKRPFGGPERVLKYLSRYTHRIAIANRRLRFVGDGASRAGLPRASRHLTIGARRRRSTMPFAIAAPKEDRAVNEGFRCSPLPALCPARLPARDPSVAAGAIDFTL